jgi:lipopolysaccharide transport system ATP-binding protein
MSDTAIRVDGLSKQYRIGQTTGYGTLRDAIMARVRRPASPPVSPANGDKRHIWALKDVSFEVQRGDAVGIIGRNGSGKSTLLKILSRITEPTSGRVTIYGRVGSLLEVGTGFHPELTGRENIYLNGAIIGMSRAEVRQRFDEIVAFAEVERFLDTPVKHYSSGMYVRLAFAVAAHLNPDVLLVDEVLAVGDIAFQRKCLDRMGDAAEEGRSVVFVSHSMASVAALCNKVVLLDCGTVVLQGSVKEVLPSYLGSERAAQGGEFDLSAPELRRRSIEDSRFKWTKLVIHNSTGATTSSLELREPFSLLIVGTARTPLSDIDIGLSLESALGFSLFNSHATESGPGIQLPAGDVALRIDFDTNLLSPGMYTIGLVAHGVGVADCIDVAAEVTVRSTSARPGIQLPASYGGVILLPCSWSRVPIAEGDDDDDLSEP